MRWGVSGAIAEHVTDGQTRQDLFVCETTTGDLIIFPILKPTSSNGAENLLDRMKKAVKTTFDQIDGESFDAIQTPASSARFSFADHQGRPFLKIEISNCNLRSIWIPLSCIPEHPFIGDWSTRWQQQFASLLEGGGTSAPCALHHEFWEVSKDTFGATLVKQDTPTLLQVNGKFAHLFPIPGKISWSPIGFQRETEADGETITVILENHDSFQVHRFKAYESGASRELRDKVEKVIINTRRLDLPIIQITTSLGVFDAIEKDGSLKRILLFRSINGVSHLRTDGRETLFKSGFLVSSHIILTNQSHQSLLIKGNGSVFEGLIETVNLYEIDPDKSFANNRFLGVFLQDLPELQTAFVEVTLTEFEINGIQKFDFNSRFSFSRHDVDSTNLKLIISVGEDDPLSINLIGPKENILSLCRFLERRRVHSSSSKEKASTLYGQLIETRKLSFLNTIFGDIALIHRALNKGTPMDELVRIVQAASGEKFVENPKLKQETVEKLTILAVAIPRLCPGSA